MEQDTASTWVMVLLRRIWVASLTVDSFLTLNDALDLLPGTHGAVHHWLLEHVTPVAQLAGIPLYRFGDIVRAAASHQPSARAEHQHNPLSPAPTAGESAQIAPSLPPATAPQPDQIVWWSHRQVQHYFHIDGRTLRAFMRATPSHIEQPWVQWGTRGRPMFQWHKDKLDIWWKEIHSWRQSKNETENSVSAGAIPTDRNAAAPVRTKRLPNGSRRKLKPRSAPDEAGSLTQLVTTLILKKS